MQSRAGFHTLRLMTDDQLDDDNDDEPSEEKLLQSLHDEIAAHEATKLKLDKAYTLRIKALSVISFMVKRDREFLGALRDRLDGSLMKFCAFCMERFGNQDDVQAHIEQCAKHPLAIERRAHEETKAKLADAVMYWRAADTRLAEVCGDEASDIDPELDAYLEAEQKEHEAVQGKNKQLRSRLVKVETKAAAIRERLAVVRRVCCIARQDEHGGCSGDKCPGSLAARAMINNDVGKELLDEMIKLRKVERTARSLLSDGFPDPLIDALASIDGTVRTKVEP